MHHARSLRFVNQFWTEKIDGTDYDLMNEVDAKWLCVLYSNRYLAQVYIKL